MNQRSEQECLQAFIAGIEKKVVECSTRLEKIPRADWTDLQRQAHRLTELANRQLEPPFTDAQDRIVKAHPKRRTNQEKEKTVPRSSLWEQLERVDVQLLTLEQRRTRIINQIDALRMGKGRVVTLGTSKLTLVPRSTPKPS